MAMFGLKPNYLYIALRYPEGGEREREACPDLLPEYLREQPGAEPALEYRWSFMVTSGDDEQKLVVKQYTVACPSKESNKETIVGIMDEHISNKGLANYKYRIDTFTRSPGTLASIPRLMLLLEMQPIEKDEFEEFLATHNPTANWWEGISPNHASHLWARNVLIGYEPLDISDNTITSVEVAARAALEKQLEGPEKGKKKKKHDWTLFAGPQWQLYIYNQNNPMQSKLRRQQNWPPTKEEGYYTKWLESVLTDLPPYTNTVPPQSTDGMDGVEYEETESETGS